MSKKIIQFSADWCQPCKMVTPILKDICDFNEIPLTKYNTEVDIKETKEHNVVSLPTIILFNGDKTKTLTGAMPKHILEKEINDFGLVDF